MDTHKGRAWIGNVHDLCDGQMQSKRHVRFPLDLPLDRFTGHDGALLPVIYFQVATALSRPSSADTEPLPADFKRTSSSAAGDGL